MNRTAHPSPLDLKFDVPSDLDTELDWFLGKSLTGAALLRDARDPDRLWEKTAFAAISSWLAEIDAYDADILRCAYASQPEAAAPRERSSGAQGRLTPVFTRFASAEPGWPGAIDWRSAMRHLRTAAEVLRAALQSYARVRGPGPCLLLRTT